jgi:hypothetical protein
VKNALSLSLSLSQLREFFKKFDAAFSFDGALLDEIFCPGLVCQNKSEDPKVKEGKA